MARSVSKIAKLSLGSVVLQTRPWLDATGNVLVATGRSGSGKSTLCRSLVAGRTNCTVINIGKIMEKRILSSVVGYSICRSEIGDVYLDNFGEEKIAADICLEISSQRRAGVESFVIDGLRLPSTLAQLRLMFEGRLAHLNISEPFEIAAERRSKRDCMETAQRIDREEAALGEYYRFLEMSSDFQFRTRTSCAVLERVMQHS